MEENVPNVKLRNARQRNNWKQQEVADRIGTTALSVGRWERGETFPIGYFRQKLCDLFGMSAEELGFIGEEQPPPSIDRTTTEATETTEVHEVTETAETHEEGDEEAEQQVPVDEAIPAQGKKKANRALGLVRIGLALIVLLGVVAYVIYLARPAVIKPGGGWISPVGKTVKSSIAFAAYAYPTHDGEPAIDHVNFTMYWQGSDPRQWVIACVARKPLKKDTFSCVADLRALGVPAGEITISFDVYDRQGNHNNAPNGPHIVTYAP